MINKEISILQNQIFIPCGLKFSQLEQESEGSEYQAHRFKVNNKTVLYRHAKITPTKIGQFVTVWKRSSPKSPIQPFDISDEIDLLVVTVEKGSHYGQFVFSRSVLTQYGILSIKGKGGKRALRVYPPWDKTESRQAKATQAWQTDFFVNISQKEPLYIQRCKALYSV